MRDQTLGETALAHNDSDTRVLYKDWKRDVRHKHKPDAPFCRSLRAVKVLLAALRSTLTVLAPRRAGLYRFALEKQLLCFDHQPRITGRAKFVEALARYSL